MITASELARALGRKNIAEATGVGLTAVGNAVVRGWFPATWFMVLSDLAKKAGQPCPPELFKMIPTPINTHNVDADLICQGSESAE